MRLVIVESPFACPERCASAGQVMGCDHERAHWSYARAALLDCLRRGEAPFASHLLFPQVLRDADPSERMQGIAAGLAWGAKADATAVYADLGLSGGMLQGIDDAVRAGRPVEHRMLKGWGGG